MREIEGERLTEAVSRGMRKIRVSSEGEREEEEEEEMRRRRRVSTTSAQSDDFQLLVSSCTSDSSN